MREEWGWVGNGGGGLVGLRTSGVGDGGGWICVVCGGWGDGIGWWQTYKS